MELILGPMFSGKTTALLQRKSGRTLVVTHDFDTRSEGVLTHDGVQESALKCSSVSQIPSGYDTILIDEAQFFEDLTAVENIAPKVVLAGLSSDYLKRPFGKILEKIPRASKVTFLTAKCKCGKDAVFTKRVSEENELIIVNATYEPACHRCY